MKVVGYGRVDPGASEVPLNTQKHACRHYCEQEKYSFENWFEDECDGEKDLLERDGMYSLLEYLVANKDIDAILTYDWKRISSDAVIVGSIQPILATTFDDEMDLITPNGEIDLTQHPDPQDAIVGRAMNTATATMLDWKNQISHMRKRRSLNQLVEDDEFNAISAPYGLITDKQRYENRKRVHEYLPDDENEDHFKVAIQVLNEYAHNETNPFDCEDDPGVKEIEDKYGVRETVQRSLWKYQETYREIAQKNRDDLVILF